MHAIGIDQQAKRRIPQAAGADRAQKGVLDPDQGGGIFGGHRLAPGGIGAAAPDGHTIAGLGSPKVEAVARQRKDAAQAGLAQEPGVVKEKPPGKHPGGICHLVVTAQIGLSRPPPKKRSTRPRQCR